jgi:hypothetical protein
MKQLALDIIGLSRPILIGLCAALGLACEEPSHLATEPPVVASLEVAPGDTTLLAGYGTYKLRIVARDARGEVIPHTSLKPVFSVDDPAIARVDGDGVVYPGRGGTVRITVSVGRGAILRSAIAVLHVGYAVL